MSKENKLLLAALLLGVWLILAIHGVAYFHSKWRLELARGKGTLTEKTISQERTRNLRRGAIELSCWIGGLILAKTALLMSRRMQPRDDDRVSSASSDVPDDAQGTGSAPKSSSEEPEDGGPGG